MDWRLAKSEFVICSLILILVLVCTCTSASVSGADCVLRVKKEILVSLSLHLSGHIEQNNVFELLRDSGCDIIIGFLGYRSS